MKSLFQSYKIVEFPAIEQSEERDRYLSIYYDEMRAIKTSDTDGRTLLARTGD